MKRSLVLSVIVFYYCFLPLAKAQSPGGVQSPEVWFGTFPVSSNLQDSYSWKDLSGDYVKKLLYDSRGADYGTEFRQLCEKINNFKFHPALNLFRHESLRAQFH